MKQKSIMVFRKVMRVGNSLTVTLPKDYLKKIRVTKGDIVEVKLCDMKITIIKSGFERN